MSEPKVIFVRVYDPMAPSIFGRSKANEPARCMTVTCSCDSCPLLAKGYCVELKILGGNCPYGRYSEEKGPTKRAAKFRPWMREQKEKYPGVDDNLSMPPNKLAFVGDYVYLPYAHANMCQSVPFPKHSCFFTSGSEFIKREHWTLENVLKLIDFRPHSMMGGEITKYQQDVVPLLLQHIRELDSEMWSQLIAARPEHDTKPDYVGRRALVRTLAYPITIPPYDSRYPVSWEWDGEKLSTQSVHAYGNTWGHIKPESFTAEIVPHEKVDVVVRDNAWITPETVFVD